MSNDYRARAQELDWSGVRALWRGIGVGSTPGWPAGRAFEHMILRAFELDGADVRWPFTVDIDGEVVEQVDGAVYAAGLACIVEAKDRTPRVDVGALAKLRNQLARRPAGVIGLLFSSSDFTTPAMALARFLAPQTVLLWSRDDWDYILERRRIVPVLEAKYRRCVEMGIANYRALEAVRA